MRTFLIFLPFLVFSISIAQPTPKWVAPESGRWIVLRSDPLDVRFCQEDSANVYIMNGVYSTTVAVTIAKAIGSVESMQQMFFDVTGDGIFDLVFYRSYPDGGMWERSGFRIVNSMNGETFLEFDNPSNTYGLLNDPYYDEPWPADIDNDGRNELVVAKGKVGDHSGSGQISVYQTNGISTAVSSDKSIFPTKLALSQNYPNPFNPSTHVQYQLAKDGPVTIELFDLNGRLIRTFAFQNQSAGVHELIWDGKNNGGSTVASGTYFYRLHTNGSSLAKKMIMLR